MAAVLEVLAIPYGTQGRSHKCSRRARVGGRAGSVGTAQVSRRSPLREQRRDTARGCCRGIRAERRLGPASERLRIRSQAQSPDRLRRSHRRQRRPGDRAARRAPDRRRRHRRAHVAAWLPGWRCCSPRRRSTFVGAYFRRYRGGRVALDVQYDLRNAMQDHLQTLDFANLDRMPTGQLVGRANSDSTLVQGLLSFFPIMSGNVLMLVFSLASCSTSRPLLARRQPARGAGAAVHLLPDALARLPRDLGRPAERGRCRPDRRRGRQRRAGRQGLRPGAPRARPGADAVEAVRLADARGPAAVPLPAAPEADPALGQVAVLALGG